MSTIIPHETHESDGAPPAIAVAVAILRSPDGRVLLCRRPRAARYGGRWEFPGGKLEPGESPIEALRRELREELAVEASRATPFHATEARYEDGGVFAVQFFIVEEWTGEPRGLAASELAWARPEELDGFDLLEGSRDVCPLLGAGRHGCSPADATDAAESSPT